MILEAAIINLTRNLDILNQKDEESISSHVKLKQEALSCFISLVENAPALEYKKLLDSKDHEILLGYMISVLCQLSAKDKSRAIREQSLNILLSLVARLEALHNESGSCSIRPIVSTLPGVSSILFKIVMSDTKLPRKLLITATKALAKFIAVAFMPCCHDNYAISSLVETCDNLAVRLEFLINYIINNSNTLPDEFKHEILDLCDTIVRKTNITLVSRALKSIVKYTAFISSISESTAQKLTPEIQLKLMLIVDCIRDDIQNCDNSCENLDLLIITCLFNSIENLDSYGLSMLPNERASELSMLSGFLKLLPPESLTTFLEIHDKVDQLIKVFERLTEFSTTQPFMFLTCESIGDEALETCNEKIYTFEKRFKHLNDKEISSLDSCCRSIGQNSDWLCLNYIIGSKLKNFSSASNLFITQLVLRGFVARSNIGSDKSSKFAMPIVHYYLERMHDIYVSINQTESICSQEILKIVISIETLVTLLELHLKSHNSGPSKVVILRYLLCPLLNWASSSCRAVSEASLSALMQISQLYGLDSTKSLIEANIDYIVDGIGRSLENFGHNTEVTNVLAITFKLSSLDSFYYFQDIFERIFRLLAVYHQTEKSKLIALLFYRTLTILAEWKEAKSLNSTDKTDVPLASESSIRSVKYDIDIERRLRKLDQDLDEANKFRRKLEQMQVTHEDEKKIADEIESCNPSELFEKEKEGLHNANVNQEEPKKVKSVDVILTEKILMHCINLISSNYSETKILSIRAAARGFEILGDDEDTLLPLVHQIWTPLLSRLSGDYNENPEISLCAFECLVSMAVHAKDFIKRRTLDSIIPRLCLFLEAQAYKSKGEKDYGPYSMTVAYKCQHRILTHLGALAYHIQLAYTSLWRVVKATLIYLDPIQMQSLREAAHTSLNYMITLDADCVWYLSKQTGYSKSLPFELIYESAVGS